MHLLSSLNGKVVSGMNFNHWSSDDLLEKVAKVQDVSVAMLHVVLVD